VPQYTTINYRKAQLDLVLKKAKESADAYMTTQGGESLRKPKQAQMHFKT